DGRQLDQQAQRLTCVHLSLAAINDQKQYYLIEQNRTWEDAQSYCRANHTDLAMIENEEENRNVTSARRGHEAWIGLYREPWMWSDGRKSSFKNWMRRAPDNQYNRQHCAVEHPDHSWDDQDCSLQGHFICQGGKTNLNSLRNLSDC
uniref:C-type lectin domain-containing protein n=1 Tax=Salarias fasciatus TaxID=181472 RepID=A0A672F6P2_SALFA